MTFYDLRPGPWQWSCINLVGIQIEVFRPELSRTCNGDSQCGVFVELFVSSLTDLTGALASDGVVEGAVDDAGVRIVLLGATPCLAHRILCL